MDKIKRTIKIKNKTLAILEAPAAIPPKPKTPATIARTTKITVHFNMINNFLITIFCFVFNKDLIL